MILWSVIWVSCAIAVAFSKDGGVMAIPAIGMLIWYFVR